ncbi:alkylhydroperoxidase [Thermogymnomonas acidicola]|uniref:Alkylhydroperoxidase n=1 Tax=Thermogymnomonas acidicola TaxID=399579 RepID=A0AA37BPP5_9ARCH|nr:carboxymuconolactone decarboxylase family protein [Thermogymnomonas acidicola]GGM67583.1 alkylhydroperoxidase [Thermogymnomonas acidicola]
MTAGERLKQIQGLFEDLGGKYPDVLQKFMEFNQAAVEPGAIDQKTKEVIAVAVSVASQCQWCITYHARQALELGATENELIEAGLVAVSISGGSAAMHMIPLREAIREFKK